MRLWLRLAPSTANTTFKEIKMNTAITTTARAFAICVAATLGFNANASAAGPSNTQSVENGALTYVVRFADLDLSNIQGTTELYGRLRSAARVVCEPLESRDWRTSTKHEACMRTAIADAVESVDRPLLSQYHQLRTKGDKAALVQLAKT
jgi:UrcA family protein